MVWERGKDGWSAEERIPGLLLVVFTSEEGLGEIFLSGKENKEKGSSRQPDLSSLVRRKINKYKGQFVR